MDVVKDLFFIFLLSFLLIKCIILQKQLFKQREYFIKTLCHDFKVSTLAQINGLNLFELDDCSNRKKDILIDIKKSCAYSLDLINMLQHIYRFENGEKFLNPEQLDLNAIIDHCINELYFIKDEKGISFKINSLSNICMINADKCFINKLISNLLLTSTNYAFKNSCINISFFSQNNKTIIEIKYDGIPLSQEEYHRMFALNPIFSTVGHGIIMFFCKKIVDFHHGKIDFKCNKNNTNSFTIMLPNNYAGKTIVSQLYGVIQAYNIT